MVKCRRWDFELHVSECAARDNKIMLKTGVMNDEDLLEGEDKSSKFKARIHDGPMLAVNAMAHGL